MFMELFLRIKYVKIVSGMYLQAVFDPVLPASTSQSMCLLSLTCVPAGDAYRRRCYAEVAVCLGSPLLDCRFLVFEYLALSRGPSLQ